MCWNWLVVDVDVVIEVCVCKVVLFFPRGHQIVFLEDLSLSLAESIWPKWLQPIGTNAQSQVGSGHGILLGLCR